MDFKLIKSKDIEQAILLFITIIGLLCLLSYTFWHTGGLLSRFIVPYELGYTCAVGVEAIIVVMSFKLARLKANNVSNGWIKFALVFALVVSAVANYAEGFYTYHEQLLTWRSWWANIDVVQFVISVLATALISVLVFVVSDIISVDMSTVSKRAERIFKGGEQAEQKAEQIQVKAEQPNSKEMMVHQAIHTLTEQGKQPTSRAVAKLAGCGVGTANKWIATYQNGTK